MHLLALRERVRVRELDLREVGAVGRVRDLDQRDVLARHGGDQPGRHLLARAALRTVSCADAGDVVVGDDQALRLVDHRAGARRGRRRGERREDAHGAGAVASMMSGMSGVVGTCCSVTVAGMRSMTRVSVPPSRVSAMAAATPAASTATHAHDDQVARRLAALLAHLGGHGAHDGRRRAEPRAAGRAGGDDHDRLAELDLVAGLDLAALVPLDGVAVDVACRSPSRGPAP